MKNKKGKELSRRELQVLKLMSFGKSNQEIAEILIIAESTVKNHINSIYKKLGFYMSRQAVHYYYTELCDKVYIPIY